jgi:hypothetical protein
MFEVNTVKSIVKRRTWVGKEAEKLGSANDVKVELLSDDEDSPPSESFCCSRDALFSLASHLTFHLQASI